MALLIIGELAIVIALFADLDGNVQKIYDYDVQQQQASASSGKKSSSSSKGNRRLLASSNNSSPAAQTSMTADQVAMQQSIKSDLEIGRYVFLVFTLFEFIAYLVTIVMRVRFPYKEDAEQFEEQRSARSAMAQIQMESLKSAVKTNKYATSPAPDQGLYTASKKMNKSVNKRMSEKYGAYTNDPAFQKKWWQKMPGMG